MAFCLLLLYSFAGFAQDFAKVLSDQISILQNINSPTAQNQCQPNGKLKPGATADRACTERFAKLYKNPTLRIVLGFGYSDESPRDLVADYYMVNGFIQKLTTKPCPPRISACGFTRDPKDADRFVKSVIDPFGKPHQVELIMVKGSLTGSQKLNTSPQYTNQEDNLCKMATTKFFNLIKEGSDVVYYSGHSRDGGGPDFCPPVLRENGHVDYTWYKANKPGKKRLIGALQEANSQHHSPQVLAMHSCSSNLHFYRAVNAVAPEMAYMGSENEVDMVDDYMNEYGSLDSILAQRCEQGFKDSMKKGVHLTMKKMFRKVGK